ncbi:hypothetical protein DDE82_002403 [Stemphylium lycopersici]|nr:hypothetical protein DDE82_002403 [Stemphylium lycopersici]
MDILPLDEAETHAHLRKLPPDYSVFDSIADLTSALLDVVRNRTKDRKGQLVSVQDSDNGDKADFKPPRFPSYDSTPVFRPKENNKSNDLFPGSFASQLPETKAGLLLFQDSVFKQNGNGQYLGHRNKASYTLSGFGGAQKPKSPHAEQEQSVKPFSGLSKGFLAAKPKASAESYSLIPKTKQNDKYKKCSANLASPSEADRAVGSCNQCKTSDTSCWLCEEKVPPVADADQKQRNQKILEIIEDTWFNSNEAVRGRDTRDE